MLRAFIALAALFPGDAAQAAELTLSGPDETLIVTVSETETVFMNGLPSLQFALTEGSSAAMADLTERMIGQDLTVSICGHNLVRAKVRERIYGRGVINMPSAEAAMAVARVLGDGAPCSTLAPHFPD